MNQNPHAIQPLGVLAPHPRALWNGNGLQSAIGKIPEDLREPIADYLENSPLFLAWMDETSDILGGRFHVLGGSGIYSDGNFYWRGDSADYIRVYGIEIPEHAIDAMMLHDWKPPKLDARDPRYIEIYTMLESYWDTSEVTTYWSQDEN